MSNQAMSPIGTKRTNGIDLTMSAKLTSRSLPRTSQFDPERTSAKYRPELLSLGFGKYGQVEQEMRSFWIVRNELQVALKLSH